MYTIQIIKGASRDKLISALNERLNRSPFRATLQPFSNVKGQEYLAFKTVRLRQAKPYCGQHANECIVNPLFGPKKKPKATYLEFNDWIRFHKIVNATCNRLNVSADIWSNPMEVLSKGKKMWIRKGKQARVKWDVEETYDNFGRRLQTWNYGTDDQFFK